MVRALSHVFFFSTLVRCGEYRSQTGIQRKLNFVSVRTIKEGSSSDHIDPRPEQAFIDNSRQAIVTVHCRDGSQKRHHTLHVRGTPANPMTLSEIQAKAQDLMAPVLGTERSQQLISQLIQLNELPRISVLRPLLKPAFTHSR